MDEYQELVSAFCYFTAQIYNFAEKARTGIAVDDKKLAYALRAMDVLKTKLLLKKEQLGLDGGLSFLEDNGFLGFRIIDGRFMGDKAKVKDIILPWVEKFPGGVNHYQFEVACYVYFMAEPDRIDLYPKELQKTSKKKQEASDKRFDISYLFYKLGKRRREKWAIKRLHSA